MSLLTSPVISDYNLSLSEDFIYSKIEEKFKPYFDSNNSMFPKIIDYINSTIVGSTVLGISVPSLPSQSYKKGTRDRSFNTSRKEDTITKNLDIEFSLKNSYLNYMIMYDNTDEFFNYVDKEGEDPFFSHIILNIIDDNGSILYQYFYKEIQIRSISPLNLKKTDGGLSQQTFTMGFKFNIFEFKSYLNGESSDYKEEYEHKF